MFSLWFEGNVWIFMFCYLCFCSVTRRKGRLPCYWQSVSRSSPWWTSCSCPGQTPSCPTTPTPRHSCSPRNTSSLKSCTSWLQPVSKVSFCLSTHVQIKRYLIISKWIFMPSVTGELYFPRRQLIFSFGGRVIYHSKGLLEYIPK